MEARRPPTGSVQYLVDKAPKRLTLEGQLLTDEGQTTNTTGAQIPTDEGLGGQHMGGHLFGVKTNKIKGLEHVFGSI